MGLSSLIAGGGNAGRDPSRYFMPHRKGSVSSTKTEKPVGIRNSVVSEICVASVFGASRSRRPKRKRPLQRCPSGADVRVSEVFPWEAILNIKEPGLPGGCRNGRKVCPSTSNWVWLLLRRRQRKDLFASQLPQSLSRINRSTKGRARGRGDSSHIVAPPLVSR